MVATARNGPRTSNRQLESSNRSARGADWPKNYIFEEREGSRVFNYDIRKVVVPRSLSQLEVPGVLVCRAALP